MAVLAGVASIASQTPLLPKASAAFATDFKTKPTLYDLRFLPPDLSSTVSKLDTLGWTHVMFQREQSYESVPWNYSVYPQGGQIHGGWSNRRLTVLYRLAKDGTWAIVNKKYSTDFSRDAIDTKRFPYLVVTLIRRRELEHHLVDVNSVHHPIPSMGCEYYDLSDDGYHNEPELDTSIEEIYGDMIFMARSNEDYWKYISENQTTTKVPDRDKFSCSSGFHGEEEDISEEEMNQLKGR